MFQPLHDKVLIKRLNADNITKGGLYIPVTAQEKPTEALVVAVGEGRTMMDGTLVPLRVKAGDRVLFGKYSGTEVTLKGEEHVILREEDILGIVSENSP